MSKPAGLTACAQSLLEFHNHDLMAKWHIQGGPWRKLVLMEELFVVCLILLASGF